jgi:hypothetical protein
LIERGLGITIRVIDVGHQVVVEEVSEGEG